jgi:glycerol-3-phosphate dehydrogenase
VLRTIGGERIVRARALVNAAGPWVKEVLNRRLDQPSTDNVKLVQGSHLVVRRLYEGEHAFILQNDDGRVVFMIPYEADYTLIGTTDVALDRNPASPHASAAEIDYLCKAVNRYILQPIVPGDVIWTYAGVRPLYDDGSAEPSAVSRDYTLRLDDEAGAAPVLSVFGGKITIYRKLAEHALERLAPWFPGMKAAWTDRAPLPGGDLAGAGFEQFAENFWLRDFPWLPAGVGHALARRHGANAYRVLSGAQSPADLGRHFGAGIYAREVDYLMEREWAMDGEDILYRRTKAGLHLAPAERGALAQYVSSRAATS